MTDNFLPQDVAPGIISLTLGHPDPQALPVEAIRQAADAMLASPQALAALQYGPEQGTPQLIMYLVDKLNREENLDITPENLMIVAGATHAINMVAGLYAGRGTTALVEAPTYRDSVQIFRDLGTELYGVPMDHQGLRVDRLKEQVARLRLEERSPTVLYTIPNYHNPTGVTLTQGRREQIVELARQHNFLIVEDDVYHDLAFTGETPPSFYQLAGGKGAIRIGSFSKVVSPGLRLGWVVAEPEVIQRFVNSGVMQMGGGANPLVANIMATYCQQLDWNAHITQLRQLYGERCRVALTALGEFMPDGVTWTRPDGGFFIWVTLPEGMDAAAILKQTRHQGLVFAPGAGFFVDPTGHENYLRIAFSFAPPNQIMEGIRILGAAIEANLR